MLEQHEHLPLPGLFPDDSKDGRFETRLSLFIHYKILRDDSLNSIDQEIFASETKSFYSYCKFLKTLPLTLSIVSFYICTIVHTV